MPGFQFPEDQGIFLYSTPPRSALEPTQLPTELTSMVISPGLKRMDREADHSPPSSGEANNCGAIPPLVHMPSWRGAYLIIYRESCNFLPFTDLIVSYILQHFQSNECSQFS
jgi:hypothetical protein